MKMGCRVLRPHIRFIKVCLCPIKMTPGGLYELRSGEAFFDLELLWPNVQVHNVSVSSGRLEETIVMKTIKAIIFYKSGHSYFSCHCVSDLGL